MFKRFRQLRIPLAAKCQILYGSAVVFVIAAALIVPWRRSNELLYDIDEKTAAALAQQVELDHVARQSALALRPPATRQPVLPPTSAPSTQAAATPPAGTPASATTVELYIPPRLIGIDAINRSDTHAWDRAALQEFIDKPDTTHFIRTYRYKGLNRFRYIKPLYAADSCVNCHTAGVAPSLAPATRTAATLPAQRRLLGAVVIDIPGVDDNELFMNRLFIFLAGTLAGLVAIGLFYLITTRLILQPVRVLQTTAEKVSQGDLNIRSDISTGDEFQQLSQTINTMLTNLNSSAEQLRSMNKALDLKVGQLAETNVSLYESNRLKSEFLANVSHELRTPLNSILGFAELLKENVAAANDAKPARYLQNILSSGRNLLELINDLLDLAKIEAGKMEVRSEPLSLGDVFEGLINLLKPLSEPKNLSIVATVSADVPIIQSDPAKLQQVLYNFLSNAIKFSPENGQIDLKAQLCEQGVEIAVSDQGPGVPADKQAVIFEKFRQIDGGVTREHSGTGLGLAISRELTHLLGGSIGVHSTPGQGAAFWIILPLNIQPGPRDVPDRAVMM